MVSRFGESNVFMDVDMAPGVHFVERITEAVAACQVLIVVMGPRWATAEDDQGRARLADPEDFVRLEVETALRRSEVTPIPVLVAGARMPNREDLPLELQAITRRNALELDDHRWRYDVGRLISPRRTAGGKLPCPQPTLARARRRHQAGGSGRRCGDRKANRAAIDRCGDYARGHETGSAASKGRRAVLAVGADRRGDDRRNRDCRRSRGWRGRFAYPGGALHQGGSARGGTSRDGGTRKPPLHEAGVRSVCEGSARCRSPLHADPV